MTHRIVAATAIAACLASPAAAQVRARGEFRVNASTTGFPHSPSVAALPSGAFVVVWSAGDDVYGRRFAATGAPLGNVLRINPVAEGQQLVDQESVAADAKGGVVVVWTDFEQEFDGGIYGRLFDEKGAAAGAAFRVNVHTTGMQTQAAVARQPEGAFVVAWASDGQDGDQFGIFTRRFDRSGRGLGAEFQVNQYTTDFQAGPGLAVDSAGGFVVTWWSRGQDGSYEAAMARVFDAQGNPRGPEFQLSTNTVGSQAASSAAATPGGFVVTWSDAPSAGASSVMGRRISASGAPLGGEFQVNAYTPGLQAFSRVAADATGGFVVTWADAAQDGSSYGVFARRFHASGAPRSGEFRVNTYTTDRQRFPVVMSDDVGNFTAVWESLGQDGSESGIYGQRYGGLLPAGLAVDPDGNGTLEPGEAALVRPAWHNVNGAAQTFGSNALSLSGPGGATYAITAALADYGTVANGAIAPCADCLEVFVAATGARPVIHWDAALEERITPDVHGQTQLWRLHLGDSFTDVPRSSPYYRFVETLLHHGITAGCGSGTTYCPGDATTREQMAAFVLVSKEGAGYQPRACTTPAFADVPASNPFCRFIEELARRGAVTGCGDGRFCPQDPVTREQMAFLVLRTLDPSLDPPACGTPAFDDVPAESPFCRWIEELARRGVVGGCGEGNYCPLGPVTREQMAVFLSGAFGLTLYGP